MLIVVIMNIKCSSDTQSKTYYVSPKGNDDNVGLSKNAAWKTMEKLNSVVFQPGDAILFESGGIWIGQLCPQGSGEAGKLITIGSYGAGAMPVINIEEAEGAAIQLVNQSWWEIKNIEITSGARPKLGIGRQGIVDIGVYEQNGQKHQKLD